MKLSLLFFFSSDVDALPEHLYVGHFNITHLFLIKPVKINLCSGV